MSLAILRLDVAGQPRGWCSPEEAATSYSKGDVSWALGEPAITLHGGIQRHSGERSVLAIQPIIAVRGRVLGNFSITLNNRALFRRDHHMCLYCGHEFHRGHLTRDHVQPVSRGGANAWANCVTACRICNNRKGNRTPEEAHMPLLAVPFTPNPWEYTFLGRDRILGDQMEYLRQQFSNHRDWAARMAVA
jgi:hypothetical protein